jgi:sigma-B regulation protein RsbU (phosphoserine phosphatase)
LKGDAVDPAYPARDDIEDLFENAPCGYISADKDGRILRVNRTLADWLGVSPEALVRKRFSDLLTIGGKIYYETHFAPLLRMQGSFDEVALDLLCADGAKRPVLVNAIERRDDAGNPLFVRIAVTTAVERRRYEQNLREARGAAEAIARDEKIAGDFREQFIAILGHDLRNPLASLASGIKMLNKEPLTQRGRTVLELMDGSVIRASTLVNNIMDFARAKLGGGIHVIPDADTDIAPVISQVVAEMRSIAGDRLIEADVEISGPVQADHGRLGQLISNLLSNALTYGSPDKRVRLSAFTHGGMFELSVANEGDPIPQDRISSLFDPFVRGADKPDQQGLGLGLHIAREIAKSHGGDISVASDTTETRFTFRMPCTQVFP